MLNQIQFFFSCWESNLGHNIWEFTHTRILGSTFINPVYCYGNLYVMEYSTFEMVGWAGGLGAVEFTLSLTKLGSGAWCCQIKLDDITFHMLRPLVTIFCGRLLLWITSVVSRISWYLATINCSIQQPPMQQFVTSIWLHWHFGYPATLWPHLITQ